MNKVTEKSTKERLALVEEGCLLLQIIISSITPILVIYTIVEFNGIVFIQLYDSFGLALKS